MAELANGDQRGDHARHDAAGKHQRRAPKCLAHDAAAGGAERHP